MTDKEILIQAFENYVKGVASNLFGFNSIPSQVAISYVVKNMADKYGNYLDLFTDKEGNINMNILANAAKEEMKIRNGFSIMNIHFSDKDIDELLKIYSDLKKNK